MLQTSDLPGSGTAVPVDGAAHRLHRRFHLVREEDETGVSGTGTVAEGIEFSDGLCAMRWVVKPAQSLGVFTTLVDLETIHGHNGKTRVVFIDD